MSGLEALAALGLACNIFQVISFGRETLGLVKSVYHDGTLDDSGQDHRNTRLADVTKKCTGVARDLQEEIAFLVGQNGQGSLRASLKIAAKANWRKRRLDRMEKALSDAEQLMQSTLMAWIFKSANMASINIHSLGHELRDFVIKYEHGSTQTSQLVASEAFKSTEEPEVLRMNERANQVEDAHAHTFRWLFADADNLSCPDSNDHQYRAGGSKGMGNRNLRSQGDFSYHSKGYKSKSRRPVMLWSSFTDWLQSDHSIYWIMGKPGSAKSTLVKFILSEPRTKMALENWRAGAIIASHDFWRPGDMLQRNIKGMLCSIICQLLLTLPNTLDYASANINGLSQKDACTDWSVLELRHWCSGLIKYCGKPLCLFIDGLDECGPEDDHRKLLDELDRIRTPGVKIVVSSRNEPVFEKRFRHEPQLRVQDLTAEDLRVYAMDMLCQEIRDETCEDLVEKAEGVFLCDIYRESAALYFKLVIAAHDKQLSCLKYGLSTMEMMLASLAQPHYAFAERHPVLGSQLMQECKAFHQKVAVRCAGLLGVYGEPGDFPMGLLKDLGGMDRALTTYRDRNVEFRFIHRSALDFLVETDEGQKILSYDGTSSENINIRIVGAHLRAVELHYLILGDAAQPMFVWHSQQRLEGYLANLSGIEDARDGAARELVSLCYEL
ncbi:hypothetical protein LA080_012194 [Diaporthe eres]|nr:hypothetical protein LA080_012194 [Diaporthe eres]